MHAIPLWLLRLCVYVGMHTCTIQSRLAHPMNQSTNTYTYIHPNPTRRPRIQFIKHANTKPQIMGAAAAHLIKQTYENPHQHTHNIYYIYIHITNRRCCLRGPSPSTARTTHGASSTPSLVHTPHVHTCTPIPPNTPRGTHGGHPTLAKTYANPRLEPSKITPHQGTAPRLPPSSARPRSGSPRCWWSGPWAGRCLGALPPRPGSTRGR